MHGTHPKETKSATNKNIECGVKRVSRRGTALHPKDKPAFDTA